MPGIRCSQCWKAPETISEWFWSLCCRNGRNVYLGYQQAALKLPKHKMSHSSWKCCWQSLLSLQNKVTVDLFVDCNPYFNVIKALGKISLLARNLGRKQRNILVNHRLFLSKHRATCPLVDRLLLHQGCESLGAKSWMTSEKVKSLSVGYAIHAPLWPWKTLRKENAWELIMHSLGCILQLLNQRVWICSLCYEAVAGALSCWAAEAPGKAGQETSKEGFFPLCNPKERLQ